MSLTHDLWLFMMIYFLEMWNFLGRIYVTIGMWWPRVTYESDEDADQLDDVSECHWEESPDHSVNDGYSGGDTDRDTMAQVEDDCKTGPW